MINIKVDMNINISSIERLFKSIILTITKIRIRVIVSFKYFINIFRCDIIYIQGGINPPRLFVVTIIFFKNFN